MYQTPEALDKTTHAGLRLAPAANYAFTANLTMAALAGMEVTQAANCFALVFLPAGQGPVLPQALLGLNGRNNYLNATQQWQAAYVPATLRQYPFALAQVGKTDDYVLAIDSAASQLQKETGELLVSENGEFTDLVKSAGDFVTRLRQQMTVTAEALAELDAAGILVDKTLTIQEGKTVRAIGGFRVAELDKLAAQDDATLAKWARNGVLQIVYAHLDSLRHLQALAIAEERQASTN
jgi:putative transposase